MESGTLLAERYALRACLGRGGMGEVWTAWDQRLYREVAVKLLLGSRQAPPEAAARFDREAVALAQVVHPNVVTLFDSGDHAGLLFLVMERVDGTPLSTLIRNRERLGLRRGLEVAEQIGAALEATHRAEVVHFDIKPQNVMITPDGTAKVVDFGIAGLLRSERYAVVSSARLPLALSVEYAAPEQFTPGAGDARSDLYALGGVLFAMLTGAPPFSEHHPFSLRAAKNSSAAPRLDAVRPQVPTEAADLVAALLERDPARRPKTAGEVRRRLAELRDAIGPDQDPDGGESGSRSGERRDADRRIVRHDADSRRGGGGGTTTLDPDEPDPRPPRRFTGPTFSVEEHEERIDGDGGERGAKRGIGTGAGSAELEHVALNLADTVRRQWDREEELRQIHDPHPLPVRFTADVRVQDHWTNIRRTGPGTDPGPLALDGGLEKIAQTYASVPSGRLVILGEAGSGKTILAVRFVLDRLADYGAGHRVPVVFSLGDWDPGAARLRTWMAQRLLRDYNTLGTEGADGRTLARALVEHDRILPVLDGFDEVAIGLRGKALAELNRYQGPLLLTSRPEEYAAAVDDGDVLSAAACVRLQALDLDDLEAYLHLATRPGPGPAARTAWAPVLDRLRAHRRDPRAGGAYQADESNAEALIEVLGTPLMVALARTVYSDAPGRDPARLLKPAEFPTDESIREHLLAEFVTAAYAGPAEPGPAGERGRRGPLGLRGRRQWDVRRARRYLGYLAWHMQQQDRVDLAWWELGTAISRRRMTAVVGLVVGLGAGIVAGAVYGTSAAISAGPLHGLHMAVVNGVLNALGAGLTFGLMHGFVSRFPIGGPVFEPSYMRISLHGGTRRRLRQSLGPRLGGGLAGGLLFGLLWVCGGVLYASLFGSTSPSSFGSLVLEPFALGTGLGVAVGAVAALGAGLEAVSELQDAAHPLVLLAKNRTNVLTQVSAVAIVIGVGYGLILGPSAGIGAGLMIALGIGTMTAWGRWVLLVRIWLPARGLAPWAQIAFLDDAYRRGVLRQAGAVYQFRHARIQKQLADSFRAGRPTGPANTG